MRSLFALMLVFGLFSAPLARAGGEWEDSPEEKRARATDAQWAKQGSAAIPAMVKALCSQNFWLAEAASARLVSMGSGAVPALLSGGSCDGDSSPGKTLSALVCDERSGASTFRILLKALTQKEKARSAALEALSFADCLGDRDAAQLKPLLEELPGILIHGSEDERDLAVEVIGRIGPGAASLTPQLVALVNGGGYLALLAIDALGATRSPDPAVIAALRSRLSGTADERKRAFAALAHTAGEKDRTLVLRDAITLLDGKSKDLCSKMYELGVDAAITAVGQFAAADVGQAREALVRTERALSGCKTFPISAFSSAADGFPEDDKRTLLLTLLRDDQLRVETRERVVTDLGQLKLDRDDEAIANAISAQSYAWNAPIPQVAPAPNPRGWLLDYLNGCRRAGGKADLGAPLPAVDEKAGSTFMSCLQVRLCGPGEKKYAASLGACCEEAFGKAPPEWCRP
ncbi:MAG: hypothetical protein ACJ790_05700 [Myxococcaceae bacterium]